MDSPTVTPRAVEGTTSADNDTTITVEVHALDTHNPGAHDKVVSIAVTGELDMRTAPELWRHVRAAFTNPEAVGVIVDLSAAYFLDSLTISVLVGISKEASRRGGRLAVVVEQGCLADRVLGLARVTDLLPVCSTRAQALATIHDTGASAS